MFLLATALLIGLDLYLSHRRMVNYGAMVELNPIARQLASDYGAKYGVLFLAWWNVSLLVVILLYRLDTFLHVLFGAKLGLAAMQLKSIQLEAFVERVLRRKH